jgi:hypothetical protein
VDAGQDAAVAPLDGAQRLEVAAGVDRLAYGRAAQAHAVDAAGREPTAQDGAVALERQQRGQHVGLGQAELGGQADRPLTGPRVSSWPAMVRASASSRS